MHSDDQDILLYLEDKLPHAERERLEAHIGMCGPCAARFAGLSRLPSVLEDSSPVILDEKTRRKAIDLIGPGRQGGQFNFRQFAQHYRPAFAGAAALLLIVSVYWFAGKEDPIQFRSEKAEETRSLVLSPEDGARVDNRDTRFHWTSIDESMVYRFSLLGETGAVLWSADVRDTSISLPGSIVLQPGKTYLWRVETSLADKTLERSAVHAFTYFPD